MPFNLWHHAEVVPDEGDRAFTAGDIQRAAGLSYRQLNDWGTRGLAGHERNAEGGWRRFSGREVFALVVCAEFRRIYGTPVERLKYVHDFMLQEDADHLAAAVELIGTLGVAVWLMTDFESVFVMDSELEFADLWGHGYFGGDHAASRAFLKVNPLVNRILGALDPPLHLEMHGRGYELLRELQLRPEEWMLLNLVREDGSSSVEVRTKSGRIETVTTTKQIDASTRLGDLLAAHDYQTVTLTKRDGRVISISQTVPTKPRTKARK